MKMRFLCFSQKTRNRLEAIEWLFSPIWMLLFAILGGFIYLLICISVAVGGFFYDFYKGYPVKTSYKKFFDLT